MTPDEIGRKYDKVAAWWDAAHRESEYGLPALERALRLSAGRGQALDVGCGSGGRMIRRLRAAGFSVTGIDVSPKMIGLARANHCGIDFHLADFLEWEHMGGFDLVVAWDSLFHLPAALQEPALAKLSRLLHPGGVLLYAFGDATGDHEDYSFRDPAGGQFGELDHDLFGYGSIGVLGVRRALEARGCVCRELVFDQLPGGHAYVIAEKVLAVPGHGPRPDGAPAEPEVYAIRDEVVAWGDAADRGSDYGIAALERALATYRGRGRALDVGCGSGGRMVRRLLAAGWKVKGIDASPPMLEIARTNHPDADFQLGDVLTFDGNGHFDLVVAWGNLFPLPVASLPAAIKKLSLSLADGGILLFTFAPRDGDGLEGVRRALEANGCQCLELEIDPAGRFACLIARQELKASFF